jgi:ribonuclease D
LHTYIDNQTTLENWLNKLHNTFEIRSKQGKPNWVALDTEFIREKHYFPQLCLIQIAYPNDEDNNENHACIDPLAFNDLSSLESILYASDIIKVFHAAFQDQEILFQYFGKVPFPIFDTQPAAAILGIGDQIGYARLVENILGISLEKSQSRTDWSQRPLSEKQLHYAIDDVRYLNQIYPIIYQKLENKNRIDWLAGELKTLSDQKTFTPNPENSWKKVRGVQQLKGIQLAVLQKLTAWREEEAIKKDRPKRWILADDILIDLAKYHPKTKEDIIRIRGASEDYMRRYYQHWLEHIEVGLKTPKEEWPQLPVRKKPSIDDEILIDLLMTVVRFQAKQHNISSHVITNRKQLEKMLSAGEQQLPNDWRGNLVNEAFSSILNRKTMLSVTNHQVTLETMCGE